MTKEIKLLSKRTLNYAPLKADNIQELLFDSEKEILKWLEAKLPNLNEDRIYLFTCEDISGEIDYPIIVTTFLGYICDHLIQSHFFGLDITPTFYLQEYESYEEAYKAALDMKEPHPLCYNK